jgi:glycosyltransferase involved in cell wall biosynthesis
LKCSSCALDYYGGPKGLAAPLALAVNRRLLTRRINALHSVSGFVSDLMDRNVLSASARGRSIPRFVIPAFVTDDRPLTADERRTVAQVESRLPAGGFILYVGAFSADKGLQALFEAYARLDQPPPLVMIGTRERDTPSLPADAVILYDVPHVGVRAAWQRALIGVVPSLVPETLGMVAIEGITHGTPMVGTFPSGMQDVLSEDAGILVPQGDVTSLAGAIRRLLEDPRLRERLIENGIRRAARYAPTTILDQYETMLHQLAGSRVD